MSEAEYIGIVERQRFPQAGCVRSPIEALIDGIQFKRARRRHRAPSLTVACPTCGAPQFFRCVSLHEGKALDVSHALRRRAGLAMAIRRGLFKDDGVAFS